MGAPDDPFMFTQDLTFGHDNDPGRVDPQAHPLVSKGCRHAVARALKGHQAGG